MEMYTKCLTGKLVYESWLHDDKLYNDPNLLYNLFIIYCFSI